MSLMRKIGVWKFKRWLKASGVKVLPHDQYMERLPGTICVCASERCFPDDIDGTCGLCGKAIVYRPYNKGAKQHVCMQCLVDGKVKDEEKSG